MSGADPRALEVEAFRSAWPQVVRALGALTRSLDLGEEYAAEAFACSATQPDGAITDLASWCIRVGQRAWLDDLRRAQRLARLMPDLARQVSPVEEDEMSPLPGADGLDDRLALLFVACDEELAEGSQLVLALRVVCGLTVAQIARHLGLSTATAAARLTRSKTALARARGSFTVPDEHERRTRLPVVLACVPGLFTVGQREVVSPTDVAADPARDALLLAESLAAQYPHDAEVLGLRAVCRLGLARRPGRVRDGLALPLDEVDRGQWDQDLLARGLADAVEAMARCAVPGRFVLEAAISGTHASAPVGGAVDWAGLLELYDGLLRVWDAPAVRVARWVVVGRWQLTRGEDLRATVLSLEQIEDEGPQYAARDAGLALADLAWRSGHRLDAARRYAELADAVPAGPVRAFCRSRASGGSA